jgi:hypothetical protein
LKYDFDPIEESIEIGKQDRSTSQYVPTLKDLSASEDKLGKINEGVPTRCLDFDETALVTIAPLPASFMLLPYMDSY